MTVRKVTSEMRKRLAGCIKDVAEQISTSYYIRVTDQEYPPSSSVGEYPAIRTGQGADSIGWGVNPANNLEARAGIQGTSSTDIRPPHTTPGGSHLYWLQVFQGRKGLDDSFFEDVELLQAVCRRKLEQ